MSDTCIICGKPKSCKNKYFCSKSCETEYKQHYRTCPICGNTFKASPSADSVCCSPACSSEHRKQLHKNGVYDNTMQRLCEGRKRFYMENSGEKHVNAKYWVIQSPIGQIYKCHNLMHFIRERPELFDGTPKQAFDGFAKIKATEKGKRTKNPSRTWKGWKLIEWSD
mgnify:FL=1